MLTSIQDQVLTGLMLGDGSLAFSSNKLSKTPRLTIGRAIKDKEYINYHANIFSNFLNPKSVQEKISHHYKLNKSYPQMVLRTKSSVEFLSYYNKWYPNGKKKTVPKDLVITPIILATWIADDGGIKNTFGNNKLYPNLFELELATQGFTKTEVEMLCEKLSTLFNFPFHVKHKGANKQYVIKLYSTPNIKAVFRYIDSSFPPGMERKSDLWRRPEANLHDDINPKRSDNYPPCPRCCSSPVRRKGEHNGKAAYSCNLCHKWFTQ